MACIVLWVKTVANRRNDVADKWYIMKDYFGNVEMDALILEMSRPFSCVEKVASLAIE